MKWFDTYSSNTLGGSGNHYFFLADENETYTGRIYYKVFAGGCYRYSLLFTNIIDSTFRDGSVSHCNLPCDEWELVRASIGVCRECSMEKAGEAERMVSLTFGGQAGKHVMPGEFFVTDAVELDADKGDYLCVEITYQGKMIPNHEQSVLPSFLWEDGKWTSSRRLPFPGMVGCDRQVRARIGFLGDSITQGIGAACNSYAHWNALVAEEIGEAYSYWNLGLGFGRANDAATDGAWLFKAKQMDMVVMCFGVNDIFHMEEGEERVKKDLLTIIDRLHAAGVKVLIQTLPPFNYQGDKLEQWLHINDYVRNTLSRHAEACFDVVPVLIDGEEKDARAKYGGHPNNEGCRAWADALIPVVKAWIAQQQ